jgi:hypothetical protein
VVEAWVHLDPGGKHIDLTAYVNRTPITGSVRAYRDKGKLDLYGCGLSHEFPGPKGSLDIAFNITTPFCPITTDGKEPNFKPFVNHIASAVMTAAKRAKRQAPKNTPANAATHKAVILEHLDEGVAKASGSGAYRFNQRQLFYVLRPFVIEAFGAELGWVNFQQIIIILDLPGSEVAAFAELARPIIEGLDIA